MARQINTIPNPSTPLPVTKNGYQFTNWGEYREAQWLVNDGSYESLEEYGESITKLMEKVNKGKQKKDKIIAK